MTEIKNLSLNDFRYQLYAVWSAGVASIGRHLIAKWKRDWNDPKARLAASNRFKKERARLRRIFEEIQEDPGDSSDVDRPVYENGNLWLSKSAREHILGLGETPARVFFDEKKKFATHLREGYAAGRSSGQVALDTLFDVDRLMLEALQAGGTAAKGFVPFGVTAGVELTKIYIVTTDAASSIEGPFEVEKSLAISSQRDWASDWSVLRRDPRQRDAAFVLQTLITLSQIGLDPVESIVEAFFRECQGTQLAFRDTVATLGKDGWITREAFSVERHIRGFRDVVYDARLYLPEDELGCIVSSINEGYPSAWFVDDFVQWAAKTDLLDTLMRCTLLWSADRVYRHHPHQERVRLGTLVRLTPTIEPPFHDVMAKLVRIGEVDASLLGIERLRGSKWEDITFYPPVLRSVIETAFERIDEIWPACVDIAKRITPRLPDLIQKPSDGKEGLFVDEFISAICITVRGTADQHGPPIIKRVCEAFQGEHHRWRFYMAVLNPDPKTGRRLLEGLDLKTIPEEHRWLYERTWDDVAWYKERCPECEKAWNEGTSTRHGIPILEDGPPGLERRGSRLLCDSDEES